MIRLYIDEDALAKALGTALRSRGFDVLTAEEAGNRGRSDLDHLLYAREEGRVLFTYNRGDYFALHTRFMRAGDHHAGIVVTSRRVYDVGTQLRSLIGVAELRGQDGMRDWLEFV